MGNSASADTSDLISSLGMLYRNPLHLELPFCNNYNPDNLSVQDQYSFSFTQHSNISCRLPAWLIHWLTDRLNEWMNDSMIQGPDFSLRLFSSFLPILTLRNSEELIFGWEVSGRYNSASTGSLSSTQFPSSLVPPNFPSCFLLSSLLPPEAPDSNCWEVSSNRIEIALNIRGLREDKQTWGRSVFGD